ncbi:MAG: preprotein translocase subunit YajC [Candidatus Aminicenantes bacterium]|nr:preprotein translocase subunit YajC [Candidatus Aminicenantes bacterium]
MILGGFLSLYQNTGQQPPGGGGFIQMLIMFGLIFVIFYVLIILPSRKRQKKHQEMVEQLKSGDKIVTTGGIYGTVMGTKEDRIEIKISANVKIDITKNSVAAILTPKEKTK